MKNKIFMVSLMTLALTLVVSGCSLFGGTQNQQTTPIIPAAPVTPAVPVATTSAPVASPEVVPVTAAVTMASLAFNPATLTIKRGTTVTWTNNDSVSHQIKSASFNSDILSQGQSYSMTFNDAGIFDYSCAIHPAMTGQLIVE